MKQVKSVTAVFKKGSKTAKSDMHSNNRNSVFGSRSISMNPLDALLMQEKANQLPNKRKNSTRRK